MGYRTVTTVTVASGAAALATLEIVKEELGISSSVSTEDGVLTRYIGYASAAIEQYCNRRFAVETVKDEFWPEREAYGFQVSAQIDSLQMSRWPVGTVSSVTENAVALTVDTEFRVDKVNGGLWRLDAQAYPTVWRAWPIVATYQGGFADTPSDVQDACVRLVKARYLSRGRDPFLKSESIPGVRDYTLWVPTGSDAGNLPPDIADVLDNYRVPVVA